ncbi:protein TolR [Uliginosibacterium sp. H1]|uniref:protein TolR n=1 Tax=Uliginosibacterium sp. H1 TaxID=3114757 RepID=UPI002E18960A|nr:protein TolR [Uliginosibacterium sp. H1]
MRQRKLMNQINVVPYIDVMLVLLVIFMVTATMLPTGTVDLPSVAKASQVKKPPLEIEVRADNDLSLRDRSNDTPARRVNESELVDALRTAQAADPERPVVIAAAKSVRYESVMKVMDLLQRNNVQKVGLLVQPAAK